jgi:hypothetical protein
LVRKRSKLSVKQASAIARACLADHSTRARDTALKDDGLAGKLAGMTGKARNVMRGGTAFCKKLVGARENSRA